MTGTNHKLATIVALDVAGFSARTEADEARTIAQIANLRPVIEGIAKAHGGRVFNTAGDGFMLEFASALSGVTSALELADECRPRVRVGVHVGEVSVQPNGDLLGHGVNVAARLMAKAEPGSAIISADVRRMIRGPLAERFVSRGPVQLDKMNETIEIFAPVPITGAAVAPQKPSAKRSAPAPLSLDRRTLMIGGGVVAAGSAAVALWQLMPTSTNPGTTPSLAVLPFSNLTGKAEDLAFAAGLHDDLLTRLASVSALRVIARTSVMRFLNTTRSASEVANELGVNAVLMGSVQRSGDQVRVAVQLIDGATDSQRWGESYDRALTTANLFGIQRDITEAIARALNTVLAARELDVAFEGGTRNLKAYELYANARLLLRSSDYAAAQLRKDAIAELDRAIALDASFAAAYALKAYALMQSFWFEGNRTNIGVRDAAKLAVDRAQALAPNALETQLSLAAYHYHGFLDYRRATEYADRAAAIAPNSEIAWSLKALIARRDGRFAESLSSFERAIALDPQNTVFLTQFSLLLSPMGRFSRAMALAERARTIDPAALSFRSITGILKREAGDIAGAWAVMKDIRALDQDKRLEIAIATRDPANINFALEDWPVELRERNGFPGYEVYRGRALLALGRQEEARKVLKAVKARLDASENPYPEGWASNAEVLPVEVPGLLGDLEGVRAAERDFLANAPRDEYGKVYIYPVICMAYLGAGDRERAAHYLDEAVKATGPWLYLKISGDPAFDALRDHPRYLALKASYETWAESHPDDAPRR